MYTIMYKYSTFKIKRKSFRSSMSKNFTVIPDLLRLPVKPAMTVGSRHPRPRPGISPVTYWKRNSARRPKPRAERKNDYISIDLRDSHPEVSESMSWTRI